MQNEYYMKEYKHYDGEANITFNLIDVNTDNHTVTVAVTNRGKNSVITYDLIETNGLLSFEYGVMNEKIYINNFEEVA